MGNTPYAAISGRLSKDELNEYVTTIEVPNPYSSPMPVRIHDQWPITSEKDVEISLGETKPWAISDKVKGTLEWHITEPPNSKSTVSFTYSVRRPKGWKLHQWQ